MARGLVNGRSGNEAAPLASDQQKLYDEDHRIVSGKFICNEVKGGSVKFSYKKWRGDPIKTYVLRDGEIVQLPKMVADHLNNNCAIPEYEYSQIINSDGTCDKKLKRMDHRFSFIYSGV